jgi:hypothetical protein
MTPDSLARMQAIFEAVVELPPSKRPAYLSQTWRDWSRRTTLPPPSADFSIKGLALRLENAPRVRDAMTIRCPIAR